MLAYIPFTFSSPTSLWVAVAAVALIVLITAIRRPALPRSTYLLATLGLFLLALAAGGLMWLRPVAQEVVVMVDLSPSTRTADYRHRDALISHINRYLVNTPHRVVYFAADNRDAVKPGDILPDIRADSTLFAPPSAAAILLFSDCQFTLPPSAPPTYIVADPKLESPADAAVTRLELRGNSLAATVSNQTPLPRDIQFRGPVAGPTTRTSPGNIVIERTLSAASGEVSAKLNPHDPWPENDTLWARIPPPLSSERWWIGASAAPQDWRAFTTDQLPLDPAQYLAPSVIVLDNVPATALTRPQQRRLQQYVRDLGGTLILLGGDHAFASGQYAGSLLEALSPLSSFPPAPTTHWIMLADSSGSMSEDAGAAGVSKWDLEKRALLGLLPTLPPEDPVSVGSFAENLQWWSTGKSAKDTAAISLPPPTITPTGPTNLQPALLRLIADVDAALPKELLLMTDAETELPDPKSIREGFLSKKIRLHILAIGKGDALPALREIAAATGGQVMESLDSKGWRKGIEQLAQAAAPDRLNRRPATVRFTSELASIGTRTPDLWNRTWTRSGATVLADTTESNETLPMAARWTLGEDGAVLAFAFGLDAQTAESIATKTAHAPHDPRFHITWDPAAQLHVTVEAAEEGRYLNDQKLDLELTSEADTTLTHHPIPQNAPGRYELTLPAPRRPAFATVRAAGHIIDRTAIAGRYAPEFSAIGNNHPNMEALAANTGGKLLDWSQPRSIDFRFPTRDLPLTSWLAAAGAAFIAIGLAFWRRS